MRSFPIIGVAILSLWLAACSFDTDDAAPMVTETAPEDGADDVATDTDITVTFSEALLGETLSTESMIVTLDGEPVPGTLSYDDTSNSLVFTPESPWIKTLEYTVTLDPEITDLARNRLGDYSFSFTVRDGEWGEAAMLSDGAGDASNPVIAFAPDGTAIAAWLQNDGANNVVNAAHYAPDFGGWGFPGPIDIYELGNASTPHISTGGNGDTFVVWAEEDGPDNVTDPNNDSIWAIRYTSNGGWEAPQQLEPWGIGSDQAFVPQVAVDGEGNAIAVWFQEDNSVTPVRTDVWYNIFSVDTLTWQGEARLENLDTGNAGNPIIAVNEDGRAVVVWVQIDSGIISSYARRYVPGDGWQGDPADPQEIDSDPSNTNHGLNPRVDLNNNGDVAVVWVQVNAGFTEAVVQNRFYRDGEWSEPLTVSDTGGLAGDISDGTGTIKLDEQGRAMALWSIQQDGNFADLSAARYIPESGWSEPVAVENNPEVSSGPAELAIDAYGNALAVWWLFDGALTDVDADESVYASRYTDSSGQWSEPELIDNLDGNPTSSPIQPPRVVIDPRSANGLVVWDQEGDSGTGLIQTNIFQ